MFSYRSWGYECSASGHSTADPLSAVTEGERRVVEIAYLCDQGDGIAKIDRGYVVIVSETTVGEQYQLRWRRRRGTWRLPLLLTIPRSPAISGCRRVSGC
ncbi:TRAM domain-containing protein [Halorubrum sp. Hd13]|uniref:TRAM domain-containing protein n=1 Tax=Halorubrum sp. Hd13 TaxID=1480728 RepID=UPI0031842E36